MKKEKDTRDTLEHDYRTNLGANFLPSKHSKHSPWKVIGDYLTGASVRPKMADGHTTHHKSMSDGQKGATL